MVTLYVEGGGDHLQSLSGRCREAFRKLLINCGFEGRMPRIVAAGGRNAAYHKFVAAHNENVRNRKSDYIAMLVDSEDPVSDVDRPWDHLLAREGDGWKRPSNASDDQVLLMTTCMETWIMADHGAIIAVFDPHGDCLQQSALLQKTDLESRNRKSIYAALQHATRNCPEQFEKGEASFQALQEVDCKLLRELPSFARFETILDKYL
ncbi:MAG: DUF4276 family protein [Capsulimonadaceae bacterium]